MLTEQRILEHRAAKAYTGSLAALGEFKHHVFIYKPSVKVRGFYRSICAGNVIGIDKVLTSTHCLLTNRKRYRYNINKIRVVAGILHTFVHEFEDDSIAQWRRIKHIRSQKFYRFPYYSLAVLEIYPSWIFNHIVNTIPYAIRDQDFNGYCSGVAVKPLTSWNTKKSLHSEELLLIPRKKCEDIFIRNMHLFLCTEYDSEVHLARQDVEGGGLICKSTRDPKEVDEDVGILVGVHTAMNFHLPTLHTKVALFHEWVSNNAYHVSFVYCIVLICFYYIVQF